MTAPLDCPDVDVPCMLKRGATALHSGSCVGCTLRPGQLLRRLRADDRHIRHEHNEAQAADYLRDLFTHGIPGRADRDRRR